MFIPNNASLLPASELNARVQHLCCELWPHFPHTLTVRTGNLPCPWLCWQIRMGPLPCPWLHWPVLSRVRAATKACVSTSEIPTAGLEPRAHQLQMGFHVFNGLRPYFY